MIQPQLLKMLVCPENHAPLSVASSELVERVNRAIAAGKVVNRAGQPISQKLDSGLVREDQVVLYAVVDEIPMMLVDEAIPLDQPGLAS